MNYTLAFTQQVDRMEREIELTNRQRNNASDAGFTLAAIVARYVDAPQEVGRGALRDAYGAFMAQHAGNFSTSTR